jgi:hypothetical protein
MSTYRRIWKGTNTRMMDVHDTARGRRMAAGLRLTQALSWRSAAWSARCSAALATAAWMSWSAGGR